MGPVQPPKYLQGQVARLWQPGSCTHQASPIGLWFHTCFKEDRSKRVLERNCNFCPVPCCSLLHSCTNAGLSGSGPARPAGLSCVPIFSQQCGKTHLIAAPGHLHQPLPNTTGTSCSHSQGHCCMLAMQSHFYCRRTYYF